MNELRSDFKVIHESLERIEKAIEKIEDSKPKRFIDNEDGTVTDSKTGLMWVKNPHTDLPDKFKGELKWQDAIDACKDLNFAKHKDWRLPTVEELSSIVDYSRGAKSGEPAIDPIFKDTKCSWYWTITPVAWGSGSAWIVGFDYGYVSNRSKDGSYYVRPVRSSSVN